MTDDPYTQLAKKYGWYGYGEGKPPMTGVDVAKELDAAHRVIAKQQKHIIQLLKTIAELRKQRESR